MNHATDTNHFIILRNIDAKIPFHGSGARSERISLQKYLNLRISLLY